MNIFWLSLNLQQCAKYHCDKHVIKMILEYAQMLSTAHRVLDSNVDQNLYKATHINHPCTIWVRSSNTNYLKLYELFCYLCKEYTFRYGKIHKTESKLLELLKNPPKNIPIGEMTVPPIAITNQNIKIKKDNGFLVVASYRNYYNIEKSKFAKWTNREVPNWFSH